MNRLYTHGFVFRSATVLHVSALPECFRRVWQTQFGLLGTNRPHVARKDTRFFSMRRARDRVKAIGMTQFNGAWWVWPAALAVYAIFRAWYDNWRGPLRPSEIEAFMARAAQAPGAKFTDLQVLRRFMETDDGQEFVMCNLVRLYAHEVAHPVTGKMHSARAMVQMYFSGFMPALLRSGGHPMMVMRQAGGYVDAWNTPPDPGWSIVGLVRYRSRRDMMRLGTDQRFFDVHPLKIAAIAETFSIPTQAVFGMAIRPRTSVALILLLAAAITHLGSLLA